MSERPQGPHLADTAFGDLRYHTRVSAARAFGPGWHGLVGAVFDLAAAWPGSLLPIGLRFGRCRDGRLQAVADWAGFPSTEEWLDLQAEIWYVTRQSCDLCEACGAPAFRPAVPRSTRVHCLRHALDWAAGLPEAAIWASREAWREGTDPWAPGGEDE